MKNYRDSFITLAPGGRNWLLIYPNYSNLFQTDLLDMASKPAEHIKRDLEAVQESKL